jgi:hypothetical protein
MGKVLQYSLEDNLVALRCEELNVKEGDTPVLQVAVVIKPRANSRVQRREYTARRS